VQPSARVHSLNYLGTGHADGLSGTPVSDRGH